MNKIEQIQEAIFYAEQRRSKITPMALAVPMLGSLQIRHLLNNLGAISTRFLDVGSHVGGSYCSAVFKNDNLNKACAIDSWESDRTEGHFHEKAFIENFELFTPLGVMASIVKSDCFSANLELVPDGIDFYSYDAGHSREDQKNALIYYKPILSDVFIYCCDDWMFEGVKEGTMEGIVEGGYDALFATELLNDNGELYQNEKWWDGYFVALLKKK